MTALVTILILLALLVAGNVGLSLLAVRRHPPLGSFIESGDVRLHYIERGEPRAPVLVLLPGNGAMIEDMLISGLLQRATARFRVICFDRPGFGHSTRPRDRVWTPEAEAELLAEALDRLGVERPVVLGHSWGTLVAVALALHRFDVHGLVLVSGYYFPTRRIDVWLFSMPAVPILGDVLRWTILPLLGWLMMDKVAAKLVAPQPVPEAFRREFPTSLALRPAALRTTAEETALLIPAATRLQHRYAELACPVAAMHGEGDQVVEPEQTQRLHRALSRAVVHLIPGGGHMVHYAAPERIVDAAALISAWPVLREAAQ